MEATPAKSSLSEFREKVSFRFFADIYRAGLELLKNERKTYRGFHVYAIDGDQLDLPATQDILDDGYRGYPKSQRRETHYPKMYMAHVYDVLNAVVADFDYSTGIDEVHMARKLCAKLEKNSITLYDRLHCGFDSFYAHHAANNYFIARARTTSPGSHKEVRKFSKSSRRSGEVTWRSRREKRNKCDLKLRLVKVKNPRTKQPIVFVTNLPKSLFSDREISRFYLRRWDIETSFRDLTSNMKMNQLHSKKINGILQEVYALLWLTNAIKMRMNCIAQQTSDWLKDNRYVKANLKICVRAFMDNLGLILLKRQTALFGNLIDYWIKRTKEKRRRNTRSYPRKLRGTTRTFPCNSIIPRRPAH